MSEGYKTPDAVRASNRAAVARYRMRNLERLRTRDREHKRATYDSSAYKMWYAQHRDLKAARHAAWRERNPGRMRANAVRWRAENPEAVQTHFLTRKKLKTGKLSKGLKGRLFERQMGLCAHCLHDLGSAHLDHRTPLALGGRHCDQNMQLLCAACNLIKGARYAE